MKSDRWKEIERIYHAALERKEHERAAFLDETCDDAGLRREVESLLGYEPRAEGFIENHALDVAAEGIGRQPAQPMIGRRVGVYEISALIGRGGMGEVYHARDTRLNRDVAIKTLPDLFSEDPEKMARFEREARILASLNHPNIATIHGLEESDGDRFLVQELIDGVTLADQLRDGPIPVEEALRLSVQIAEALEAAHERGIIHRDLKPANIKITSEDRVKVLDFGLAKATRTEQRAGLSTLTAEEHAVMGTLAYMSPEQARGKEVDRRTDVWAFGCVLFEMLAGRMAFEGGTVSDTIAQVLEHDPDWDALPEGTPSKIRDLLERCLDKDVRNRRRDIGDIRVEIDRLLSTGGMPAEPVADLVQARPQTMLPLVAAIVITAVLATVAVWNLKPVESGPVSRFHHDLPAEQVLTDVARTAVAISPDGSQFVYVTYGGMYRRSMNESEASLVPGTEGNPRLPFFSPDGKSVGYFTFGDRQLKKIAVSGGLAVTVSAAALPSSASWESGDTILFVQREGIMRVSADGGDPELLVRAEEGEQFFGPKLLPDGESVLYTMTNATGPGPWDEAQIVVQPLAGGNRKVLVRGGTDGRYVPTGHLTYAFRDVLYAVPFDLAALEVVGERVPIVEDFGRNRGGTFPSAQYVFAANGSLVYVVGDSSTVGTEVRVLKIVDRDGVGVERLPKLVPRRYYNPRVSPDGTQVAVQIADDAIGLDRGGVGEDGQSDIWVYDLSEMHLRRLTQEGNNSSPIWTRDSERITFASDRDGTTSIYWQPAGGSDVAERLTRAEEGTVHVPGSWSPDGILSFTGGIPGSAGARFDVWTLSLDGTDPQVLAGGPGLQGGSAFSPDGNWVAYSASDDGRVQLYVEPVPNPNGVKHQITQDGGSRPVWSPDGSELFYRRSDARFLIRDSNRLGRVNTNEHECFIIRHGDHTGAVLSHRAGTAASAGQRQSFEPDGLERHFVCG